MKLRPFVEGGGAAILLLASCLKPPVSPHHLFIYHTPFSASPIVGGLAIDLAVASVLFAVVLILLDRYSPRQSGILWVVVLALLVTMTANFGMLAWSTYRADYSWGRPAEIGMLCATLGVALLLWRFSPRLFEKSVKGGRFGLMLLGTCIFWVLPQLVYIAVRTNAPEANAFNRSVERPAPSSARVVWILLDELSYDQVYEHRQPDVQLPHFDQLKKNSVVFSDVQPAGYYTDRILPSLFIGTQFDRVRSSLQKDLYVHDANTSRWKPFDAKASIFGEAKQLGWTTGVAGYYNPYCNILRDVLDSCYWLHVNPLPHRLSPGEPAALNVIAAPFEQIMASFKGSDSEGSVSGLLIQAHIEEYQELITAADSLVQNEPIRFVFLHLPVPHPPGIYDRKTNTLGVRGTYLDNLVLADKTVADLLDEIQKTAAASRTTVIISSDHSWRVDMWRDDPLWNAEEERASGGKFDPRPFLLVHFPESETGEVQKEPISALAVHDILGEMLKNNLRTQSDLDQWLSKNAGANAESLAQDQIAR